MKIDMVSLLSDPALFIHNFYPTPIKGTNARGGFVPHTVRVEKI